MGKRLVPSQFLRQTPEYSFLFLIWCYNTTSYFGPLPTFPTISLESSERSPSVIGGRGLQGAILEPLAGENASAAPSPVMGGASHPSVSPAVGSDAAGPARKRTTTMAGLDSSPGSIDDIDGQDNQEEKKRQPVKRACNECRQQKVSSRHLGLLSLRDMWLI